MIAEQLRVLRENIIKDEIEQSTYDIALQLVLSKFDPNRGLRIPAGANVMHILCAKPYSPNRAEFASFWLSLNFDVPIDLETEDPFGFTSIGLALVNTTGEHMLKIILESEPGKRYLQQEYVLYNIKFNGGNLNRNALQILICHLPLDDEEGIINSINDTKLINNADMVNFCINPYRYRTAMRVKHGYGSWKSSRLFCIILLLENKILIV